MLAETPLWADSSAWRSEPRWAAFRGSEGSFSACLFEDSDSYNDRALEDLDSACVRELCASNIGVSFAGMEGAASAKREPPRPRLLLEARDRSISRGGC